MKCPICSVPMIRKGADWESRGRTRDHILPRCRGGSHRPENIRIICRRCNETLGAFGNCVGAVAAMRAVIGRQPVGDCLRWWRRQARRARAAAVFDATKPDRWCAPMGETT